MEKIYLDKRIKIPEYLDDFIHLLFTPYKIDNSSIGVLNNTYLDKENTEIQFKGGSSNVNIFNRSLIVIYKIINTYFPMTPSECFEYLSGYSHKESEKYKLYVQCFYCDDVENLVTYYTRQLSSDSFNPFYGDMNSWDSCGLGDIAFSLSRLPQEDIDILNEYFRWGFDNKKLRKLVEL